MSSRVLWSPSKREIDSSRLTEFASPLGFDASDYALLHRWSVERRDEFWSRVWDFCAIEGDKGERILEQGHQFLQSQWFPDARLNYAENVLRNRSSATAIVGVHESGKRTELSHAELSARVSKFAAELRDRGVSRGDRVVGWLPNTPEAVIAMLATTSLGAVWSSCSPDFGASGALDRFGQIAPKVLLACESYTYGGRKFEVAGNVHEVLRQTSGIEHVIWLRPDGVDDDFDQIWSRDESEPQFDAVPFNHPLFVMYSSGTTGKPKCIVHGVGGTLLQHMKEHQLQCDFRPDDVIFFFTTSGWMMWNWLVSALATGCAIVLFDGSPFYPNQRRLIDLIDAERIRSFGVSAKYLSSIERTRVRPRRTHDLSSLRSILSTGSPLSPESFQYVYREFKDDIWLASISGGTDLISCFVLGNPWSPVHEGQIQGPGLGMATSVYGEGGESLLDQKGELVCTHSFPSAPIGFWNDPDDEKLRSAYFERFENTWAHGDFAEVVSDTGGYIIHGRSDAVLNPSGVRIGTAEIYRQVETVEGIVDAVCVAQEWEGDTRIVLFVVVDDSVGFDDSLVRTISRQIRENATPRHVPAKIIPVPDIPRTRSGKVAEIAVREAIHGREVKNTSALANAECLKFFESLEELAERSQ